MTRFDEKSIWKWMPWAPIAVGMLLTAWAAVANHDAIALYNDGWVPGSPAYAMDAAQQDGAFEVVNMRK